MEKMTIHADILYENVGGREQLQDLGIDGEGNGSERRKVWGC
jgi:hypothetical protein